MFCPVDETRPKCKWPEHDWKLKEYVVVAVRYLTVAEVFVCTKCGRLRIKEMKSESA